MTIAKFSKFITDYRSGSVDEILGGELQKLVHASQKHSKIGQLKITVSLKPKSAGEMEVTLKFDKKVPDRDTINSIMFVTPDDNLINNDPNQRQLFDRIDDSLSDQSDNVIKIKEIKDD